jgi:hypothetical protein
MLWHFQKAFCSHDTPITELKDKLSAGERERLSGLLKTAQAELLHLQQTDQRLFGKSFSPQGLVTQLQDIDFLNA